jgi:hypothetical protein
VFQAEVAMRPAHPGAGRRWRGFMFPDRLAPPLDAGRRNLPRRRLLVAITAVGLVVAVVLSLWWIGGREERRRDAHGQAIREVLFLRAHAGRAMWDRIGREMNAGIDVEAAGQRGREQYLQAIASVDLTRCPPDFAEAYLRYVNAERDYERLSAAYGSGFGTALMALGEYVVTGQNPANRFAEAQRVVDEANLWLVQAALRHGVDPAAATVPASAGSAGG